MAGDHEVQARRHRPRGKQLKTAHARAEQVVAERAATKAADPGRPCRAAAGARLDQGRDRPSPGTRRPPRQAQLKRARRGPPPGSSSRRQQQAFQQSLQQDVVGASAVSPDETATVAPPSGYGGVVGIAMQYLGTPYRWGGASPGGFDCSGFVLFVYSQVGVSLPHYAALQYSYGVPVYRDELEPGDLVFFDGLGHVGIYIGGGEFIHAPHTGDVVKISAQRPLVRLRLRRRPPHHVVPGTVRCLARTV